MEKDTKSLEEIINVPASNSSSFSESLNIVNAGPLNVDVVHYGMMATLEMPYLSAETAIILPSDEIRRLNPDLERIKDNSEVVNTLSLNLLGVTTTIESIGRATQLHNSEVNVTSDSPLQQGDGLDDDDALSAKSQLLFEPMEDTYVRTTFAVPVYDPRDASFEVTAERYMDAGFIQLEGNMNVDNPEVAGEMQLNLPYDVSTWGAAYMPVSDPDHAVFEGEITHQINVDSSVTAGVGFTSDRGLQEYGAQLNYYDDKGTEVNASVHHNLDEETLKVAATAFTNVDIGQMKNVDAGVEFTAGYHNGKGSSELVARLIRDF